MRGVLDIELLTSVSGSRYLAFNVFNVRLDFDEGVATIEDELDPARSQTLSLEELRGTSRGVTTGLRASVLSPD